MKFLVITLVLFLNIKSSAAVDAIVAGTDINWTLIESAKVNSKTCFTCAGTVTMGSVIAGHCGQCFGLWKATSETDYCMYYIGPTSLSYDKVREYKIAVHCTTLSVQVSTNVVVKITPNSPPYFDSPSAVTVNNPVINTELVDFKVVEYDSSDTLSFTLETSTYSSKFKILNKNANTAYLTPITDLTDICQDAIELKVKVTDGFNPPVGPITVTVELNNVAPIVTGMNRVIAWAENRNFYQYFKGNGVGGAGGDCTLESDPNKYAAGIATTGCGSNWTTNPYYQQADSAGYDFETDVPVNLTMVYSKNGNCPSKPVWLYIRWKDVNEKPALTLTKDDYTANEGVVSVTPEYQMVDPDTDDTHKYKITTATRDADFEIDENTGRIYSTKYINLNGVESEDKVFDVQVTDKGSLTSEVVQLTITIKDVNDNAPVLDPITTTFYYMECEAPGLIQTITAQDADFGLNKAIKFIPANSGTMTLDEAGLLKLTGAPINKQFDSINIQAVDKGTPAKYSDIQQVSVIGQPCDVTTPPPTVPPPTTIIPVTTPPPTTTTPPPEAAKWWDDPMTIILVALAGLMAFILFVLAACCIIRCCKGCSGSSPKGNMIQPQRAQAYNMKSPTAGSQGYSSFTSPRPSHLSPPDEGKTLEGDNESGVYSQGGDDVVLEDGGSPGPGGQQGGGYNQGYGEGYNGEGQVVGDPSNESYGYWKEHYADQNLNGPTDRRALPATILF